MLATRRPTFVSFVLATLLLCVGALGHAAKTAKTGLPKAGVREFTTKAGVTHRYAPYQWETKSAPVNNVRQIKGKEWASSYSGTEALNPAPSIKSLRSVTLDNGQINTTTIYKNGWTKRVFQMPDGTSKQITERGKQTFTKWFDAGGKLMPVPPLKP